MDPLTLFASSVLAAWIFGPEDEEDRYGDAPPAPPGSAGVLRSAALAPAGWERRNVLAAGARGAWQRRLSGAADEADFAVLRAARPGIASSESGPISAGWSRSPWSTEDSGRDVGDAVVEEMFGESPGVSLSPGSYEFDADVDPSFSLVDSIDTSKKGWLFPAAAAGLIGGALLGAGTAALAYHRKEHRPERVARREERHDERVARRDRRDEAREEWREEKLARMDDRELDSGEDDLDDEYDRGFSAAGR